MKKLIQIILAVVIVGLVYIIYDQISTPIRFEQELKDKKALVIDRIKDIRTAERAFRTKYQRFTGSFDTLINFILNDSLIMERRLVDEDDSAAMAQLKLRKIQNVEEFSIPVIDTVFAPRKLSVADVQNLRYIPGTENKVEFLLAAGSVETGNVVVPVMECKAPYKMFLDTVKYRQELINLIDENKNIYNKYPGVKVGDINQPNNEAGNWE